MTSNRRRRFGRRAIRAIGIATGAFVLGLGAWAFLTWWFLPDVAHLATQRPDRTAYQVAYLEASPRGARFLHEWVDEDRISIHVKRAVLCAEDLGFFGHDGFDTHEIRAAIRDAWEQRRFPRGASTLTQQLARNLFLSPSRTPWRKLEEAMLTQRLEAELTKRRILEIYLNVVEFGPGIYGVEAASQHFFGIPAAYLSERQAAELAAVLPRPSVWHPGRDSRGYQAAVNRILGRMETAEFLWRRLEASPSGPAKG